MDYTTQIRDLLHQAVPMVETYRDWLVEERDNTVLAHFRNLYNNQIAEANTWLLIAKTRIEQDHPLQPKEEGDGL